MEAVGLYGRKDVKKIADYVGTRTAVQVRTHAQKYHAKLDKKSKKEPHEQDDDDFDDMDDGSSPIQQDSLDLISKLVRNANNDSPQDQTKYSEQPFLE